MSDYGASDKQQQLMSDFDSRLHSVTAITKAGVPGNPDAIVGWACRRAGERAVDNLSVIRAMLDADQREEAIQYVAKARFQASRVAINRGRELHAAAERIQLGQPLEDAAWTPYVEQYVRFLERYAPVFEMAEAPVYNLTWRYAGTLDTIALVSGLRLLWDVKSTDKPPDAGRRPPWPETALQLVAYRRAEWVGVTATQREYGGHRYYIYDPTVEYRPMPEVDGAAVLVVSPYDYRLVPVVTDDAVWATFLHAREVARWTIDLSKRVIGPAIATP